MRNFSVVLLLLAIAGCGGGGSGSGGSSTSAPLPSAQQTVVNGVVFSSDVFTSGVVKAYDFSSGTQGGLLASTAIGFDGTYKLTVPSSSGAILIETDSGCYNETAIPWQAANDGIPSAYYEKLAGVCPSSPSLSAAVVVPAGAATLVVAVTPYTHAAVGLAEYEIRNVNTAVATAVNDANSRLSVWVGTNIQTTLPTAPVLTSTSFSDSTLYGSLLSGIPSWLMNIATTSPAVFGTGTLTTIAFADAMKSDLAEDGVFNGIGRDANGNAVSLVIGNATLSTTIYRHEMAYYAVIRVRAETEGGVSLPTLAEQAAVVSFLPSFVAYNDSVNSLVDTSAVVALDNGGTVVTIGGPSAGATLTGNAGFAGFVHEGGVGIPQGNTVILVDGAFYTTFGNQYMPSNSINTTIFQNGNHTLTIQATNNLGHIGTASVTVNFFN